MWIIGLVAKMSKTKIEWTDAAWNPVTGCTPVSPGCAHCYARRMAKRLAGRAGYPAAPHEFDVTLHYDRLEYPLRWRRPRRVFVCSMSDLFHEDVPMRYINNVFEVMEQAKQHTFQVLTKRPQRMREYILWWENREQHEFRVANIWLGVTAENQELADERIPTLLDTHAVVRFVSAEPLLSSISFDYDSDICHCGEYINAHSHFEGHNPMPMTESFLGNGIYWVIVGGETGPRARPMHPDWARDIRDQCIDAGVPFFFKRHGASNSSRLLDGQEWSQYPEETDV